MIEPRGRTLQGEDETGVRPPGVRPPGRAALGVVYFTVFLDLLGFGIILPFLPYYALEMGATGVHLGIILTSYSLAQLVGAAFLGRLSDRFGRRPILLGSLAGSTAAMMVSGLAGSILVLSLARALAGLFGGSISTAQAYIADVTRPAERARYMGMLGAAIGSGFVVGPALGVALNELGLGFAGAAFTAAGLMAANLLLAVWKLPESRQERTATVLAPLAWLRGLARPGLWQPLGATFATTFAFVVMETIFAFLGKERFAMAERSFGLVLVFVGVVMIVVQGGLVGRLSERFGVRWLAVAGGVGMGLSLAAIPFCPSLFWAVAALGALAAAQGLSTPSLATLISRRSGQDEQGSVLGAGQSLAAAARAVGPLVAGVAYDFQAPAPFLLGGLLAAVAGILLVTVKT